MTMTMEVRDEDVYRVSLRAPLKRLLLDLLRDRLLVPRGLRPELRRGSDGHYSAVLFIDASALPRLAAYTGLEITESINMSARLRETTPGFHEEPASRAAGAAVRAR